MLSLAVLCMKLLIAGACSIVIPSHVKLVMKFNWLDKSCSPADPVVTHF